MGRGVIIRLDIYVPFRGRHRWRGEEEVPAGTAVRDLPAYLGMTEPELVLLVNGRWVDPSNLLADGDEVAVLRQSEGG